MDFAGLLEAWADNERKGDVEFSTILTDRGSEPFNNSEEIFIVVFGEYVFYWRHPNKKPQPLSVVGALSSKVDNPSSTSAPKAARPSPMPQNHPLTETHADTRSESSLARNNFV